MTVELLHPPAVSSCLCGYRRMFPRCGLWSEGHGQEILKCPTIVVREVLRSFCYSDLDRNDRGEQ